jgi:hypothetical protein
VVVVVVVRLLLLLRGGSVPGIGGSKMIRGGRGVEVVLWVDKGDELVVEVFVVGVHFHRSLRRWPALRPFKSDLHLTFTPHTNKQPNISGNTTTPHFILANHKPPSTSKEIGLR